MSNTPKLGLPEFAAAQALPETKANDVSRRLEQGAGLFIVADKDATSPPGSPAQGVAYIVGASATGAWSGHDGEIAYYQNTAWKFIVPGEGFFAWVLDESALYHFLSSAWSTYAASVANETIDDRVAALLVAGTGITLTYNDGANSLTIDGGSAYTDENARDAIGAALTAGTGISVTVNDGADTITIANTQTAYTDEQAMDAVAAMLTAGTGISLSYNDASNTFTITNTAPSAGTYTDENARDAIGAAMVAGSGISVTVNDGADTITIANTATAYTDENARDAIGTALVAGAGIAIAVDDAGDTITIKATDYRIGFFFTTTPTVSEVIALHVVTDAFTLPANFATPNSKGSCGTNPTASFALDVQKNGTTIGTITISTGGAFTFATASGTSKSIAAGDVIKVVAPSPIDATCANVAVTLKGTI